MVVETKRPARGANQKQSSQDVLEAREHACPPAPYCPIRKPGMLRRDAVGAKAKRMHATRETRSRPGRRSSGWDRHRWSQPRSKRPPQRSARASRLVPHPLDSARRASELSGVLPWLVCACISGFVLLSCDTHATGTYQKRTPSVLHPRLSARRSAAMEKFDKMFDLSVEVEDEPPPPPTAARGGAAETSGRGGASAAVAAAAKAKQESDDEIEVEEEPIMITVRYCGAMSRAERPVLWVG